MIKHLSSLQLGNFFFQGAHAKIYVINVKNALQYLCDAGKQRHLYKEMTNNIYFMCFYEIYIFLSHEVNLSFQ